MNIILTGFMMSGKTGVGYELANMMKYDFIDTDSIIEKEEKITINEIFEKFGEKYFRDKETEIAKRVSEFDNCVISTGGGMVLNKENMDFLRKNGFVVNLKITPEIIKKRMESSKGTRPLIKNSDFEEIVDKFKSRESFYSDCDFAVKIDGDKSPKEYAEEILEIIKTEMI